MTIKNKDGSVYKLKSPNPIMKSQDLWKDFTVHNMIFEQTVEEDKVKLKKSSKIKMGTTVVVQEEKIKEKDIIKPPVPPVDPINIPQPKEVKKEIVEEEQDDVERPSIINDKLQKYEKTIFNCLPAIVHEKIDDLYGEKSIKVSYSSKFTFESIILEETDMNLLFWTHLNKITKFTILYPRNKEKRWWQVEAISKAPEGYFVKCHPSTSHPNF